MNLSKNMINNCLDFMNKFCEEVQGKIKDFGDGKKIGDQLANMKQVMNELNKFSEHFLNDLSCDDEKKTQHLNKQEMSLEKSVKKDDNIQKFQHFKNSQKKLQHNQDENENLLKLQNSQNAKIERIENFQSDRFNSQSSGNISSDKFKRGPYRQYSQSQKLQVLKLFEEGMNFSQISKKLGVPSKNVVRWCRNGVQRKPGAGRKVMDPQMQQQLYKWLADTYQQGESINSEDIRNKAKDMSHNKQFNASLGWLKNFKKRFALAHKYKIL